MDLDDERQPQALKSAKATSGQSGRASTASMIADLTESDRFKFEALKSAFYHEDREHYFARLHKVIMFVVAMSGTAALAAIASSNAWIDPKWIAASTAAAGIIDLVFDLSGKAREHATLRRRFLDVNADFEAGELDERRGFARLARLYAEEPPAYRVANFVAYNSAMRALGRDEADLCLIPAHKYMVRHWLPMPSFDPSTRREIDAYGK